MPSRKPKSQPKSQPKPAPERARQILDILERVHPEARCALDFRTPSSCSVATILSAQCTDERVNRVTPELFAKYPDRRRLCAARRRAELEEVIRSTGFFRNKAKTRSNLLADIVDKHGGQVPRTMEELTALRGVGRKTANVVLGNAFGIPGLVVDTHVGRVSKRLGSLTDENDPVKVESR